MNVLAVVASSDIGDPGGTRTVYAIIAVLVVMGIALIMVALWLRRTTRPDPELLGPLEVMGDRAWREGDPESRRQRLDEVRAHDAHPLERPTEPPDLVEASAAGPADSSDADEPADVEPVTTPGSDPAPEPEREASEAADAESQPEVQVEGEVDVEDEGQVGQSAVDGDAAMVNAGRHTPSGLERPDGDAFDDVFEHDIDPEVLERARAELDAELRRARDET